MSMWDSQELFLAGFVVYIGLRHTALSTTAHFSGDFSRRWCRRWYAWFFEIFVEFKLDFICSNLCFAANPISTLCGFFWYSYSMDLLVSNYTDLISFSEYYFSSSRAKSPILSVIKGTIGFLVWKPLKSALSLLEAIWKNLSFGRQQRVMDHTFQILKAFNVTIGWLTYVLELPGETCT